VSAGPFRSAARQRAANVSNALESGPPEIARITAAARSNPANSIRASAAETGSAVDALLFTVDALLHADRRARIFAQDLAQRCAGRLPLAERRERLAKPKQCIRRLGRGFVFGRDIEEGFGGVTVALALEQTFAKPVLHLRHHPIVRVFAQEDAEAFLGE